MKLRVPGEYTGFYGTVEFKDGVSVRMVSPKESNLLRAIMAGVEIVQDDGVTVDEALMSFGTSLLPYGMYVELGVEPPSPYLTDWQGQYPAGHPLNQADEPRIFPQPVVEVVVEVVVPVQEGERAKYTMAYLEKLADEKGIAGIRAITDDLDIKGRSIKDLIAGLVSGGYVQE